MIEIPASYPFIFTVEENTYEDDSVSFVVIRRNLGAIVSTKEFQSLDDAEAWMVKEIAEWKRTTIKTKKVRLYPASPV